MKARQCFGLVAFLFAPITFVLQAAGLETTTNSPLQFPQSPVGPLEALLRMFVALLFVISILILGVWLFKKTRFASMFYRGGQAQLKILESRSLGYRNSLIIVGYNQRRFLLAASATGVSLLSSLPDALPDDATGGNRSAFTEQLAAAQERKA